MRFTWGLGAALAGIVLIHAPGAEAQYSDNKIKIGTVLFKMNLLTSPLSISR